MVAPTAEDFRVAKVTIYHELRGQSLETQKAMAWVFVNRVKDGRYPNNIAAVCKQYYQYGCW